jgi:hypothetical protein
LDIFKKVMMHLLLLALLLLLCSQVLFSKECPLLDTGLTLDMLKY